MFPEGSGSTRSHYGAMMPPPQMVSPMHVMSPQNYPMQASYSTGAPAGFYSVPMVPSQPQQFPAPQPLLGLHAHPQANPAPQRVPVFPATPTANGDHSRELAIPGPALQAQEEPAPPVDMHKPTQGELVRNAALLFLVYLPFYLLYVLLFTEIGFGATFFKGLAESATWWEVVSAIGFFLLITLYLLDMSKWSDKGRKHTIRFILVLIVIFAAAVSVALTFTVLPYAPILSFLAGMTVVFAIVHQSIFKKCNLADYLESLGMCLIVWGITGLAVAVIWSAANNFWWGEQSQQEFRERLRICEDMTVSDDGSSWCLRYGRYGTRCPKGCAEREEISACAVDDEDCLAALVLWVNPFIMAVSTLVVGSSMHFIASQDTHGRGNPTRQNARIFIIAMLIFIFIIWLAAAISGGSGELSNMVMAFAATGLLVMFALLARLIGFSQAGQKIVSQPLYHRIMSLGRSDWLRGAFVMSVSALLPPFLLLSWLNKRIRLALSARKEVPEPSGNASQVWVHALTEHPMTLDERELTFTARAHNIISDINTWNWTSVLAKANIFGFVYFVVQVLVGKVTTLFLAWLNIQLAKTNIWAVSAIIWAIGIGLFAIPAVPGVPAYLACGVIIGARGEVEGWTFAGTMLWAILVAWVCKHVACLMQQKVFGEQLGNSLWVRSSLMVNSDVMKAIKIILTEPRLTLNKVYILVGGPDWPTSVMTGVLRLPWLSMQIGTTPIVLPIALTVLAGGGMTKSGESETWKAVSSLFLTLAGAAFGGTMLVGLVAVENVKNAKQAEIDALENDKEVEKFDKDQEEVAAIRAEVGRWGSLGLGWRALMLCSVATMYVATYTFFLFGSSCFEEIEVITPIDQPPINNDISKFIKYPMGYWGLGLEGLALVLWYMFNMRISQLAAAEKARRELAARRGQGGELTMQDVRGVSGAMRSELANSLAGGGIGRV